MVVVNIQYVLYARSCGPLGARTVTDVGGTRLEGRDWIWVAQNGARQAAKPGKMDLRFARVK